MKKKKTIKINFKYFCKDFDPEDNFFTNFLRKEYNVVIDEDPDYIFYSVYGKEPPKNIFWIGEIIKKISPTLYLHSRKLFAKSYALLTRRWQKPKSKKNVVKIFYGAEHTKPNMDECDWAFSSEFEEEFSHPRHMRLPVYLVNDFTLKDKAIPPIKKKINFKKIKKEKNKFCVFIYSQEDPFRNEFFKKLSKYKKIDSPGRCMTNMPPIGSYSNAKESRSSKNWVKEKLKFIKPYKFIISFENASVPGWITEKLTHPMLVNSIPIYFGDKFVEREFNTKSFINYHDFKNMKDFVDYIIKVDNDDKLYERILKEPWFKKNKLPELFKEENYLKRFKKIFG